MRIRSAHVVTPQGVGPADVVVEGGTIAAVESCAGPADYDVADAWLLPGGVDVHLHINEPGRTHWEGFETATKAAAAGGVTTLVDMPLNSIPSTTSAAALAEKIESTHGKLYANVGFYGGVVPGNSEELGALWEEGVLGFKAFLAPSGVDEFQFVEEAHLCEAFPILAELGATLLVHSELPGPLEAAAHVWRDADPRSYDVWLASRPPEAELEAIRLLLRLQERFGTRVHIVHLATERALPLLAEAQGAGAPISAETCVHYLTFCAEEVPDGATQYKCAPPIRSRETREALWGALADGLLSFVTTDHSPSPPDIKHLDDGRFDLAWGGIASLQLFVSALWTQAHARGYGVADLVEWTSARPAEFVGLGASRGKIAAGYRADLTAFDPTATFVVDRDALFHRHAVSPYHGRTLRGVTKATWCNGELAYDDQGHHGSVGEVIRRGNR